MSINCESFLRILSRPHFPNPCQNCTHHSVILLFTFKPSFPIRGSQRQILWHWLSYLILRCHAQLGAASAKSCDKLKTWCDGDLIRQYADMCQVWLTAYRFDLQVWLTLHLQVWLLTPVRFDLQVWLTLHLQVWLLTPVRFDLQVWLPYTCRLTPFVTHSPCSAHCRPSQVKSTLKGRCRLSLMLTPSQLASLALRSKPWCSCYSSLSFSLPVHSGWFVTSNRTTFFIHLLVGTQTPLPWNLTSSSVSVHQW